jgi:hypothetical protein
MKESGENPELCRNGKSTYGKSGLSSELNPEQENRNALL